MPNIGSYADLVTAWGNLIEAVDRSPDVQQTVQEEVQLLVAKLAEVQTLRARQLELKALRQEITQKLQAAVEEGKDVAIGIRSVLRGKIGPRNERLVHYDVVPLRRNRRKPVEETPEEEAEMRALGYAG